MNLIIKQELLDELKWSYEILEENDNQGRFYFNLSAKLNCLNSPNKNPLSIPNFSPEEIKDILDEISNIETKAIGQDKKIKLALKMFYIDNKFAKEISRKELEKNVVFSTKTGKYSLADHYKHKGKYYIIDDNDNSIE